MRCDVVQEALSALLDGGPSEVEREALDAHLAACATCRAWQEGAHRLTRWARLHPSPAPRPSPQLFEALHNERARVGGARRVYAGLAGARLALALVAACQVAVAVPLLVLGQDRSAPVHVAHEMGSLDLAVAAGFLAAVRRPARAMGMLSLVGLAAGLLVLTAVIDLAAGRTTLLDEAPHLAVVAGWLLLRRVATLAPPSDERPLPILVRARAARTAVGRLRPDASTPAVAGGSPAEESAMVREAGPGQASAAAG